mmetsp:Transcript_82452/g.145492  ORF Transcript_82452/g.145492 Transcript_82452/m.145492 type:complete len:223 (+) Transcript_82452:597-1265(+)
MAKLLEEAGLALLLTCSAASLDASCLALLAVLCRSICGTPFAPSISAFNRLGTKMAGSSSISRWILLFELSDGERGSELDDADLDEADLEPDRDRDRCCERNRLDSNVCQLESDSASISLLAFASTPGIKAGSSLSSLGRAWTALLPMDLNFNPLSPRKKACGSQMPMLESSSDWWSPREPLLRDCMPCKAGSLAFLVILPLMPVTSLSRLNADASSLDPDI